MRVISLRCNGLISAVKQGLIAWLNSKDADVICLQDVRVREHKVINDQRFCPKGFEVFYFDGEEESTGGVAIFTRHTPKAIIRGLGPFNLDRDARYIQADFDNISVVSLLPPGPWEKDSKRCRKAFLEHLESWMRKIRKKRRLFIFCGDFGIALRTIDVEEWHKHNDSPGFRKSDRCWLDSIMKDVGYVDAFRQIFENERAYSWFPNDEIFDMPNPGAWRTDLQIASSEMSRKIVAASYAVKCKFDDRVPLIIDYDIELEDSEI